MYPGASTMYGDNEPRPLKDPRFVDESRRIEGFKDGEIITVYVQKISLPFIYFTPDKGYYPEWKMNRYYFFWDISYPERNLTLEEGKFYNVKFINEGRRLMYVREVFEDEFEDEV